MGVAKTRGVKLNATRPTRGRSIRRSLGGQDVAPRRPKVRPSRLARLGAVLTSWPMRALAALGATSGLLLSIWSLALISPTFQVRQAVIEGNQHVSQLEVLRAAAIGSSDNLLTLRTHRVERRLSAHGWVERAEVKRDWPGTVRIIIQERQAAAMAHTAQGDFYLDGRLAPIGGLDMIDPLDLPWITGLSRAELIRPDQEAAELLERAARLLGDADRDGLGRVSEVNLNRVWGLSLVFDDTPATVRLGRRDPAAALAEARRVMNDMKGRGELTRATLIDLSSERWIVVRLGRDKA